MYIKTITLMYDEAIGGFPQEPLDRAQASGNLIEVRDHFFLHGGVPHLTLILLMADAKVIVKTARPHEEDPSKDLPDRLIPLYRTLRRWRNERAKQDGVPSYVLFRNFHLAEICRRLPRSKADLLQIEGIGEATWRKYGEELLALIPHDLKNEKDVKKEDAKEER